MRVRHRVSNEIGTILSRERYGQVLRFRVAFPSRLSDVAPCDIAAVCDDPFGLLAAPPPVIYPYEAWLRREALRLADAYRNDPTAALSNSRVEPQHHQISVAIRALEKPQPRLILADEVGLGKTIEAGLILKELRARGVLDRVLILAPASLVIQWQTELRSKFNEVFVYHDGAMLRELTERHPEANPWAVREQANVIASVQYARLDGQRDLIASAPWDLVIVDEAHHARRTHDGANLAYQLLEEMRDQIGGLLLLTATPMQLHDFELYSMVELVEPGLFDDYAHFQESREHIAAINRQVSWLRIGPGSPERQAEVRGLLARLNAPGDVQAAALSTPDGRAQVADWLEGRHLLSEALVRNRKAEVGGFMKRKAHRLHVQPNADEVNLEQEVQAYLRREYARSPAFGLVLVTFQKLLASSSRALALALERRAENLLGAQGETVPLTDDPDLQDELDKLLEARLSEATAFELQELRGMAARAREIRDSKLDVLERELDELFGAQVDQKVLIFTQYLGTLELIQERLGSKFRVNVFHGGLDRREKESATQAFKRDGQVLISTEAGGEGRNFQFCHILFNYDLPWNPMRIEQRIGRLDRVGQRHNVLIYNFGVRDTLDERILDVLENRIRVFTESVGALEPILGDLEERIKKFALTDAESARREFEKYEVDLDERLRRARAREEQMRDLVMDARSFRRDEVAALLGAERMAGPDDLERFVLAALARYPDSSHRRVVDEQGGVYTIDLPEILVGRSERLRERHRGTFDFRAALDDETLDFFAFGHPLVDAVIASVTEEGSVAPIGALDPLEPVGGLLVDYEVRFGGVRERQELLSHVIDDEVKPGKLTFCLPDDPNHEVHLAPYAPEDAARMEEASRADAGAELERRAGLFDVENEANFEAERARLEKLYRFQQRHFEQRILRVEEQIERLERFGGDSERRVIPALRGRIEQDLKRVQAVREEREAALQRLEVRRRPSQDIRVLGVTVLGVPSGRGADEKGAEIASEAG